MHPSIQRLDPKCAIVAFGLLAAAGQAAVVHAEQTIAYRPVGSSNGNFTMLGPVNPDPAASGGVAGGTNDVTFSWDGTLYTSSGDYTGPGGASNAMLSSPTGFFNETWEAHTIQIFGPGTYTFDPSIGNEGSVQETGTLTLNVGPDQLGAHMLFNWGAAFASSCGKANCNIDVVVVWNKNVAFGSPMCTGGSNCGATPNTPNADGNEPATIFMLASADGDGNGVRGVPMPAGGPFQGFHANFSLKGSLIPGTNPNPLVFVNQTDVSLSTQVTSDPVPVDGLLLTSPISVSGGEYEVNNNGTWRTANSTVNPGDTVRVRHTSSASPGTDTNTVLTIGSVSGTFTSTTIGPDFRPTTFVIPEQVDVPLSTVITSAPVPLTGFNQPTPISVSGGSYSINSENDVDFVSENGEVLPNDVVRLRHTSSASIATATETLLTVGQPGDTVSAVFRSVTVGDTTPDQFTFVDQFGVPTATLVTSASVTITGINAPTSISVDGGEYEINGDGNWTTEAGTVNNNDTVRVRHVSSEEPATDTSTMLTVGTINDTFTSTTAGTMRLGNFTMLGPQGGLAGGTNDVRFTWDGTTFTSSSVYTGPGSESNAMIFSSTPFNGYRWTAHTVQIFGPGTYSFDVALGGGVAETGTLTMTVGDGQLGAHMLFNWGAPNPGTTCGVANCNIDVVIVWDQNATFGPTMYTGAPNPSGNDPDTLWLLASSDGDGDGISGIPMAPGGPFAGFRANFNLVLTDSATAGGGDFVAVPHTVSASKKMPGCSISLHPVSPLERGDWWLVAGFMVWLAWARRRAQRQSSH